MEHTSAGTIRSGIWKNALLWSVLLTAFLLLLITAASRKSETPSFEPGGRILIADFREETGANLFGAGLRPILNLALDQSRQFRVYPESELRESLRWLAADPQSPATAGLALQVCSRERIPVFLLPRLSRADGFFVLSASLYEVRNNRIFREVLVDSVRVGSEPELLYAVEHLAIKVRRHFGEKDPSPAMIGSLFPPRPALPAQLLQLFVHANFLASQSDYSGEQSLLELIAGSVPTFALARMQLGFLYMKAGRNGEALEQMAAAKAFSETLPPKPRHRIRAAWHSLRQEFAEALHEHESLAAVYPEDWQTHFDMGEMAFALYDYSRAVGEYQSAISLNSAHLASLLGLSQAELFRGNTLSARRAWERAQSMDPQDPRVLCARAQLDLVDNNVGAALSGLQKMSAASSPAARSRGNYLLAQVQIYGGRFQSALATLESGIAEDRQNGDAVSESRKRLARFQIQALLGNTAAVSAECAKTTAITGDIATLVAFGSLCANSGSLPATRLILSQIESRPDSPSKGRHVELLRGQIALAAGRAEEAIATFIKARALHPGHPPLADLARSYALAGRHEEAAKEYKELSEQKAPVLFPADSPWFSAAWVNALFDAGRLALKMGNRQEAQQYLRNYLWALDGADPELPTPQDAKALLRRK